jgi:hypothetical protein
MFIHVVPSFGRQPRTFLGHAYLTTMPAMYQSPRFLIFFMVVPDSNVTPHLRRGSDVEWRRWFAVLSLQGVYKFNPYNLILKITFQVSLKGHFHQRKMKSISLFQRNTHDYLRRIAT